MTIQSFYSDEYILVIQVKPLVEHYFKQFIPFWIDVLIFTEIIGFMLFYNKGLTWMQYNSPQLPLVSGRNTTNLTNCDVRKTSHNWKWAEDSTYKIKDILYKEKN